MVDIPVHYLVAVQVSDVFENFSFLFFLKCRDLLALLNGKLDCIEEEDQVKAKILTDIGSVLKSTANLGDAVLFNNSPDYFF